MIVENRYFSIKNQDKIMSAKKYNGGIKSHADYDINAGVKFLLKYIVTEDQLTEDEIKNIDYEISNEKIIITVNNGTEYILKFDGKSYEELCRNWTYYLYEMLEEIYAQLHNILMDQICFRGERIQYKEKKYLDITKGICARYSELCSIFHEIDRFTEIVNNIKEK